MADDKKSKGGAEKKPPAKTDDDVVGKVYDSRLMRRLLTYLRPYELQTALSAIAIFLKAATDVLGPYLTKVAVDTYMSGLTSQIDQLRQMKQADGSKPK